MLKNIFSALELRLKQIALEASTPQLTKPVGAVPAQAYIDTIGYKKLGWRALRRSLAFIASGQSKSRIDSLEKVGGRGLWLYFGEDQIGDALMDLAPRSLLQQQGFTMDLLTDKSIAHLFQDDPWFETVTADIASLTNVPYDFALVLSRKRRSIQIKRKYFTQLPWTSILETFTGPNFDRAAYATQRLCDLLGPALTPAEFSRHAGQKLKRQLASADFAFQTSHVGNAVALCVGGVDPLRTFTDWTAVIGELMRNGRNEFLLIGSDNGIADARRIEQQFGGSALLHNYVGKCSVAQSHDLLAAAQVVVCADGGLMHLAATTSTPLLGLFSSTIRPEWRLPLRSGVLFARSNSPDVNDIFATEIAEKILQLCESDGV